MNVSRRIDKAAENVDRLTAGDNGDLCTACAPAEHQVCVHYTDEVPEDCTCPEPTTKVCPGCGRTWTNPLVIKWPEGY